MSVGGGSSTGRDQELRGVEDSGRRRVVAGQMWSALELISR